MNRLTIIPPHKFPLRFININFLSLELIIYQVLAKNKKWQFKDEDKRKRRIYKRFKHGILIFTRHGILNIELKTNKKY